MPHEKSKPIADTHLQHTDTTDPPAPEEGHPRSASSGDYQPAGAETPCPAQSGAVAVPVDAADQRMR